MDVARMSEAISGNERNGGPGYRFAHSGYGFDFQTAIHTAHSFAISPLDPREFCTAGVTTGKVPTRDTLSSGYRIAG